MSLYKSDSRQEQLLNLYLDDFYRERGFSFTRVTDKHLQRKGIDIEITYGGESYKIDEKAQLHYLNKDLPTFTFELSYFNNDGKLRMGWFLDKEKQTDFYFLITAIVLKNSLQELNNLEDIYGVKVTSINRTKLFKLLQSKNLNASQLQFYDESIRFKNYFGKNLIEELDSKTEGLIYFTQHLSEKPLNLQLRLQYLIDQNVAKRL